MFIRCESREQDWSNHTLIVPAVSVGNVGQLSADLLISTLRMSKVGYIYCENVLPLVGNDPFATADQFSQKTCKLVTSVEVYESTDLKLLVVQQRAPLVKGRKRAFINELFDLIKATRVKRVVVLTSSFAHERLDSQLTGSQLRYLVSPRLASVTENLFRDTLSWIPLERKLRSGCGEVISSELYLPGGGAALDLLNRCCDADLEAAVLSLFCSEGDNAADAIQLSTHLNAWLRLADLEVKAWIEQGSHPHFPCM